MNYTLNISEIKKISQKVEIPQKVEYAKIKDFINSIENIINGDEIQEYFFNSSDSYDVFLSHSFKDIEQVSRLCNHLTQKGLKVFVDSMIWGNYKVIVKKLEDEYEINREDALNHLHTILLHSLSEVILKCRHFVFIESGNSTGKELMTYSPWIFHELYMANKKYEFQVSTEENFSESIKFVRSTKPFIAKFERVTLKELQDKIWK